MRTEGIDTPARINIEPLCDEGIKQPEHFTVTLMRTEGIDTPAERVTAVPLRPPSDPSHVLPIAAEHGEPSSLPSSTKSLSVSAHQQYQANSILAFLLPDSLNADTSCTCHPDHQSTLAAFQKLLQISTPSASTVPAISTSAVPIQNHYPAFAKCTNAAEFNTVAKSFVETTHLADAVTHAYNLIAQGKGIPRSLAAQHLLLADDIGLTATIRLFQDSLRSRTIQPHVSTSPSLLRPLLPIQPYLQLRPTAQPPLPLSQSSSSMPSVPSAPTKPLTSHFIDPSFDTSTMSTTAKRNYIATNGLPLRLPDGFVPNNGVGVTPYPPSIAPPSVIEVHIAKLLAAGKGIILPLIDAQRLCAQENLLLNLSNSFLQEKLNSVLMRFIVDYTNSANEHNSINNDSKSNELAATWTLIQHPGPADISQLYLNAKEVYGDQPLHGIRLDIDDAYPRVLLALTSVTLCAVLVVIEGQQFAYLPFVSMFGIQDVNFAFHLVTIDIDAQAQARDQAAHGCQLSTAYTDDFLSFRPQSCVQSYIDDMTKTIDLRVAPAAMAPHKTLAGPRIPMIGYDTDAHAATLGVLEKHFATVWYYLFTLLPTHLEPNFPAKYSVIDSLSSHMIRLANLIPPLLPFSRGLAANMRKLHHLTPVVHLSERSITDIWMWRATLHCAIIDARWLSVPMSQPILFRRLHNESDEHRATRQSLAASHNLYADACTSNGGGLGAYLPSIGWISTSIPSLTTYTVNNKTVPVDINVLEFIAAVLTLISFTQHCQRNSIPTHQLHIHIWTDNTSCKSWIASHRSDHPLHCFLLQIFGLVQTHFGLIVTVGHIKGENNIYADAVSRSFNCKDSHNIKAFLQKLPQFQASQHFISTVLSVASLPSLPTSVLTARVLTALGQIISSRGQPSVI